MSSKLFDVNGFEVWSNDVVRLTNGMYVGICGIHYQFESTDENKLITVYTTPISSIHSQIYPRHIAEVVARFDNDNDQMQWFFDNNIQNPLFITVDQIDEKV